MYSVQPAARPHGSVHCTAASGNTEYAAEPSSQLVEHRRWSAHEQQQSEQAEYKAWQANQFRTLLIDRKQDIFEPESPRPPALFLPEQPLLPCLSRD